MRMNRLDEIPWADLECLCGTAEHVPSAVRGLLSEDLETVEDCYWKLENHVVVQDRLFEAAAQLPDILIEALDLATHKAAVLDLLFLIGNGSASDPTIEEACHSGVVQGLQRWLASPPAAEPWLREAVEQNLRELQEFAAERARRQLR